MTDTWNCYPPASAIGLINAMVRKISDLPPRSRGRTIVIGKDGKPKAANKTPRAVALAKRRRAARATSKAQKP